MTSNKEALMREKPRYPGIRVTANGNQLVSYHTETRITDAGIFYPITPSTEGGELYQQAFAEGKLNVFGHNTIAVEAEGEHAAQGGVLDSWYTEIVWIGFERIAMATRESKLEILRNSLLHKIRNFI
jgi:hypothetical protein